MKNKETKQQESTAQCAIQNVNASTLEEIYKDIEIAFKAGAMDFCPGCNNITKVYPNPYYFHKCEHCGWEGSYNECRTVTTKDFVIKILSKYLR